MSAAKTASPESERKRLEALRRTLREQLREELALVSSLAMHAASSTDPGDDDRGPWDAAELDDLTDALKVAKSSARQTARGYARATRELVALLRGGT
jgi:hypothetical protein